MKGKTRRAQRDIPAEMDALLGNHLFQMKLNEVRLVEHYRSKAQEIKVSIIMPTWDRETVIQRAIDSVLRQKYCHYKLIIVDDGSSDATEELVRRAYGGERRIKYVMIKHAGVCHARNVGLDLSEGTLIGYLDTDNTWSENYLLLMVNSLLDHPEFKSIYCGIRVHDHVYHREFAALRPYDRASFLKASYIDLNVFMHHRDLLLAYRGFDENLTALEDWELIIRYTKDKIPFVLECCLADYYFENEFDHLSLTEDLAENAMKLKQAQKERGS